MTTEIAAAHAALLALTKSVGIALALLDDTDAATCHSLTLETAARNAVAALKAEEEMRMAPYIARFRAVNEAAEANLRG